MNFRSKNSIQSQFFPLFQLGKYYLPHRRWMTSDVIWIDIGIYYEIENYMMLTDFGNHIWDQPAWFSIFFEIELLYGAWVVIYMFFLEIWVFSKEAAFLLVQGMFVVGMARSLSFCWTLLIHVTRRAAIFAFVAVGCLRT